jgi:hypothetical protein
MVVRGRIVNRPSDGHERAVSSALVVVPRGASMKRSSSVASKPVPVARVWDAIASDPASTGGMAYSMGRSHKRLSPDLRRASAQFRRSSL